MKKIVIILSMLLIIACGGGGGGDVPPADHVGTYEGTLLMNGVGPGGTVSDTLPITVQILGNGELNVAFPDTFTDVTCTGDDDPVYLNGNSFSGSGSGSCNIPDIGVCSYKATMSGSVSGNTISGSGEYIYNCPDGITTVNLSFTASKTTTSITESSSINGEFIESIALEGTVLIPELQ